MNRIGITIMVIVAVVVVLIAMGVLNQDESQQPKPLPTPIVVTSPSPEVSSHPLITVDSPQPGEQVTSPLVISGQARGPWFFEASFPVVLTNWDGLIIAEGAAMAQGEWMTEDFVPFTAELEFTVPPSGERGFLILRKANASGLPENDDTVEIPVFFQ